MSDYIFMTGAPGSKWSTVARNIYFSSDINRLDFSQKRTYYHAANGGKKKLLHHGSYFDPGMEFGNDFERLDEFDVPTLEAEFNRPFPHDLGIKIIKSHYFAYHLDFLKENWSCPIVLVYRSSDACMGWWIRCGHFNITYPNYQHYVNIDEMMKQIDSQNKCILKFIDENDAMPVKNSLELATALKLDTNVYYQDYEKNDVKVYVYWNSYDGARAFT